jgi:hypothetical protein
MVCMTHGPSGQGASWSRHGRGARRARCATGDLCGRCLGIGYRCDVPGKLVVARRPGMQMKVCGVPRSSRQASRLLIRNEPAGRRRWRDAALRHDDAPPIGAKHAPDRFQGADERSGLRDLPWATGLRARLSNEILRSSFRGRPSGDYGGAGRKCETLPKIEEAAG